MKQTYTYEKSRIKRTCEVCVSRISFISDTQAQKLRAAQAHVKKIPTHPKRDLHIHKETYEIYVSFCISHVKKIPTHPKRDLHVRKETYTYVVCMRIRPFISGTQA